MHDLLGHAWLSEHTSNCLSGFRACLLPLGSAEAGLCHMSCATAEPRHRAGLPAQHTGQGLLLTSLGFSMKEGLAMMGSRYLLEQLAEGGKKE